MASGVTRTASGKYTGTGAALEIIGDKVGFYPRKVEIYRLTTALDKVEHLSEVHADGVSSKQPADGGTTALQSGSVTPETTGFSLGTDAGVNNTDDEYAYICYE